MSEEDRAAEIEKMKVKKKTTIMAWIITGILIIVPFLLAQIMAFLLTYNYNKSNFSGPNSQINEQEQSRPIPSVLIEMYGKY